MRRATAWGPVALVFSALLPLMANAAAADAQDRAAPPDPGGQEPPPLDQAGAGETVVQPLPESGTTVTITKKVDASGTVTQEVRDHRGRGVDLAQVLAAEGAARQRRHGRVDRELGSMLAAAGGAEQRTPVAIWVNSPAVAVNRGAPLDEQLSQLDLAVDPTRRAVLDAIRRFPNQRGARPARFGPVVFADLTPGQIRAVAARDDVSMVYGQTEYSLTNDDATTSEGAARVWQQGNVGTGSRPVVLEPDGVSDTHPDLNNGTHPVVFWCASVSTSCPQGKQINNAPFGTHASQVAGVISSTNAQYRGTAPKAQLILSANSQDFSDANLVAAFEWAVGNGGNPINMSWASVCPDGGQSFMSRYVDWAVKNLSATVTISAGNASNCAANDLQVSAPGNAWSAITVGVFDDGPSGFWSDDKMADFSRHQNPTFASGMEKPEVVAVGVGRITTNDSGFSAGSNGTSFAAPAVAGQVAQLLSRQPAQASWPETNKAAVLVSAFHDIEGGLANRSRDGVGAIVMNNSDDTYRLGRFFNDSGDATAGSFPKNYTIPLTAGQVARVATTWDANSAGGAGPSTLGADIDLCVFRNDTGAQVACSASIENAWELVEFTAPVTGSYTIRVTLFRSDDGWPGTFLGTAWSTRVLPTQCTGLVSVPATGRSYTNVSTANGATYLDAYAGWAPSQSGRERVFRLTLPTTRDITVTDTNPSLDLHIVQFSTCSSASTTTTVLANGSDAATVDDAPAGTYYLLLDGPRGFVGAANVGITVSGP